MACTGTADHCLFDGHHELDELHILLDPAPDAGADLIQPFQYDGSLGFVVKRQNGVAAEFLHRAAKTATGFRRHQVAMKRLSRQRPRHRAIRTDQPQIKPKLLGDGQCEHVPSTGDQHNFYARGVRPAQRHQIALRNLKLWIEQRAVDICRQQSDGRAGNLHP